MTIGRPRKYATGSEARDAKRERDRERLAAKRLLATQPKTNSERNYFQCCVEWQQAGRSNRTWCPQHKQWRAFGYQSGLYRVSIFHNGDPAGPDRDTIIDFIENIPGWRVSADPDSWKPIDRFDKKQDKALAEWIDAGMPGAAEMKEIYANEAAARLSHVGRHSQEADARRYAEAYGYGIVEITAHRMPGTIADNNSDKQLGHVDMAQRTKTYKTFAAALRRQGVLTRKYGICPGIRTMGKGCYQLTFDPDIWIMTHDG